MLANAPGGISGQVSKAWKQATDPAISGPSNSPGAPDRDLVRASPLLARGDEGARRRPRGSAPARASYGTLRLRYRLDGRQVQHAHGYVVQTLSDLGWVGLALSLLAAGAWLTSAARTVGIRRRDRGLPWDAERVGLASLAVVAIVFGVHSAIDWTWFVPGNVAARAAVRGLGRVTRDAARARRRPRAAEPRGAAPGAASARAAVVTLLGLVARLERLQPVRADHAQAASLERLDQGELPAAASIARIAHDRNPLVGRPAVRPRGDRAGRAARTTRPSARSTRRSTSSPRTRRRGASSARSSSTRRRPEGRAALVPDRLLPRSALQAEHDRHRRRLAR